MRYLLDTQLWLWMCAAPERLSTGELPPNNRDPFDRLIVAQALEDDLTLVTGDRQLSAYRTRVLRA